MPNQLIISEIGEDKIVIDGIADADDALTKIAGASTDAAHPTIIPANHLKECFDKALVSALSTGEKILDGYVKFAAPIIITSATEPTNHNDLKGLEKTAHWRNIVTIDDSGLFATLQAMAAGELEKSAACPFVENLVDSINKAKVHDRTVELDIPFRLEFADDKAKEAFMALAPRRTKSAAAGLKALYRDGLVEQAVRRLTEK